MPLTLHIPQGEFWNYFTEEYEYSDAATIHIEHSLAAIAKWEGIWKKPFLGSTSLGNDELRDYIRCMTLEDTEDLDPRIYRAISYDNVQAIQAYMESPMTATWFKDDKKAKKGGSVGQAITAEIIYYYMVELGIPFECENWHFNRLMTLIRVCSEKQAVPKKMSRKDIFAQNAALNAKRKARLGTRG